MLEYYEALKKEIDDLTTSDNLKRLKSHLRKRKAQRRVEEVLSDDSNVSEKSITNLRPEVSFSDVSG